MIRFAHSTQLLWTGKGPRKLSRWMDLCKVSLGRFVSTERCQRILGFKVHYLNEKSLRHLYHEIFASEDYMFSCERPNPVIFDCGANIVMATLYFKWLYPQSRIMSFEPDPETFQVLRENVQGNQLHDVALHNIALWHERGTVSFYVPENGVGLLQMSTSSARMQGREIRVPSQRLSDFIESPIDLLKLDVEGAEHQVVGDLVESGRLKEVRQMIVEYHHNVPGDQARLGSFLRMLEESGMRYQLNGWFRPFCQRDLFQDILIYAYR
jgi:FkbM family methyltransferase